MTEVITLAEAQKRLGADVRVCLEPEAVQQTKEAAGKAAELWCWDSTTGRSGRGDGRFFDVRYVDRGGWGQLELYQEPKLPDPPSGEPRIIGHVVVEVNLSGRVRGREAKGLNGPVSELKPSSISKGELAAAGDASVGLIEADPQRVGGGYIEVYRRDVDFPDTEGFTTAEFRARSTDGRALAALAKAGLL